MPSKKISDMAALTSTATNDEFVVVDTDATETKRITSANLKTAMAPDAASESAAGTVELATTGEASTGTDTSRAVTAAGVKAAVTGTQDMWIPVAAMRPAATNPCADITSVDSGGNSGPDLQVLDFDKDSDEHAQFSVAMPKSWDGGNITFSAYWIGLASTDGVAWGLQVKSLGDGEDINVAYGTAVVVTDDSQGSATEINVSATSGTIACSGAAGDILFCQILRDVSDGNDDLAGDARLVGIKINYTTNATTDA